MECNKDDASKAKVIAERKLTEKDFAGAKKFALKAQALYPGTEGLSQLMMTIDVYVFAEKKVNGVVDWYSILGVTPNADDETIRKQYRKLALMLHPDKNKCIGADGAFKLISEAWSLLSDKTKRLAYNQKRSLDRSHSSNVKPPNTMPQGNPNSAPRPFVQRNANSFWTTCQTCKMHYEYLRIHLNNTLLCSKCHTPFKAVETAPPSKYCQPPNSTVNQSHKKPKAPNSFPQKSNAPNIRKPAPVPNTGSGGFSGAKFPQSNYANIRNPAPVPNTGLGGSGGANFQHFPFGKMASVGPTVSSPSVAAKAANVVQQANERMKRAREEAQGVFGWEQRVKYAHMSTRELTPLETYNMLMKKARTEILQKMRQLDSEALTKGADLKKGNNASNVKQKNSVKPDISKPKKNGVSKSIKGGVEAKKSSNKTSNDVEKDDEEINVPDPDFYEFDQDRLESSFAENQVWAAYDDDNGMPRFYAMVHNVISLKPFKMRISWLESKSNTEFSNMKWVDSGFYKSCGEFKLGKPEFTKSLNSFSHRVKWVKSSTGSICIIPKKGEVWALYRNWSKDWTELTPDEVIHKYDMFEVLEDYNEGQGISIAPLVKVSGFRTVFRTCNGPEYIRKIPKEEMLRFSHQVPNHLLTGEEAKDAPKGLQELDTACTPLEFMELGTENNEMEMEMDGNRKKKDEHVRESTEASKIGVTSVAGS